ncbi:MAG TPA: hypothetical protein ENH88_19510 [Pseudoalteromonas prydzensis]|uniref:RelA/SpoT domain-containing protein n=1 Tax=Pseudoalteromonas prydzensis TaxID=182141 RepID=A0A7V1D293_9GAMM|nr:hypothetical protein [Pseudoalteromonas prydzensis]HEA18588.1 hypothetical protein [Pseudoalteromonas prydzensis]
MNHYQEKLWKESPELIRGYYDNIERYKRLSEEVDYILTNTLSINEVEVASISSRSKSIESFCEKIYRKSYKDSFKSITDFAAARVVFLYEKDRASIETKIEQSFDIIEKVNKVQLDDIERFGYGALHYIVKLKANYVGERYNDIRDLRCEIQVRTILQDAWALVAHHLSYKQESDVPKHLRRKLNALSGLFETADDQFQHIRDAREDYQQKLKGAIDDSDNIVMTQEIEIDSLIAFLKWKHPDRVLDETLELSELVAEIKFCGVNTLQQLQVILNKTEKACQAFEAAYPPYDPEKQENCKYSATGSVRQALEFLSEDFINRFEAPFAESVKSRKNEFKHLVEKT